MARKHWQVWHNCCNSLSSAVCRNVEPTLGNQQSVLRSTTAHQVMNCAGDSEIYFQFSFTLCFAHYAVSGNGLTDRHNENAWEPLYFSENNTKYIPIYIQQDATLHSLFIFGNCSTCSGCYFHPSSGIHTAISTASDIYHTVTATCQLVSWLSLNSSKTPVSNNFGEYY